MPFIDDALTVMFFACAAFVYLNVLALWRDKAIKGVSVWPVVLFFFVDLLQAVRFYHEGSLGLAFGAFFMLLASAVWLILAAHFRIQARQSR